MATRIGGKRSPHLYIREWMKFRGLSDDAVGSRIGVERQTVYRWRTEQRRLDPEKIGALAEALDVDPVELYRLPSDPSLDAIVKDAPADLRNTIVDVVRRLVAKG